MMPLLALISLLAASPDGAIVQRSTCEFPSYETAAGIGRYATKAEYDAAIADPRFTCEKLTYSSDDLPVIAYSFREKGSQARPLVVYNRGSFIVNQQLPLHVALFRRLAEAGFAILAPMYRESEGAPGKDEMGGGDLNDLRNVIPLANNLGSIDLDNVFLYGESRGGIMILMALRDGFPARAAAFSGAITDFGKYLDADPRAKQLISTVWPDLSESRLAARSAVRWADRITVPLLVMHGGADQQVQLSHPLNLIAKLEEAKKPYAFHVFGGESHVISGKRIERDQQAIIWFKSHMK